MAKTKEPTSRPKQYYVLKSHKEKGVGNWKQGDILWLDPNLALPYIGASILTPLASAINTKIIPPVDPKAAAAAEAKAEEAGQFSVTPPSEPNPKKSTKKTLAKNKLRAAVQAKKVTAKPDDEVDEKEAPKEEPKLPDDKSAKIEETNNADNTKETKELSEAEKAIQEKIASLKVKKKSE